MLEIRNPMSVREVVLPEVMGQERRVLRVCEAIAS
jgi:hypothetical protein